MQSSFKTLLLSLGGAVATVELNRPKKKNAITVDMYLEIQKAFAAAAADADTKAIVLTGKGDYFSSGNDLSNFSRLMHPRTMAAKSKAMCYNYVDAYISCPKPIVVAANGPAIGIAVTAMGLCDRRFAVSTATFRTPFRELGQAPEGCSTLTFEMMMGRDMAHQILEEGRMITAPEAKEAGFLHNVARDNTELLEMAKGEARKLAEAPDGGRWYEAMPGLVHELRRVNQREVDVLEEAWVSRECFDALDKYLWSRKQYTPALVLRVLNKTRFFWDR